MLVDQISPNVIDDGYHTKPKCQLSIWMTNWKKLFGALRANHSEKITSIPNISINFLLYFISF